MSLAIGFVGGIVLGFLFMACVAWLFSSERRWRRQW